MVAITTASRARAVRRRLESAGSKSMAHRIAAQAPRNPQNGLTPKYTTGPMKGIPMTEPASSAGGVHVRH